MNNIVFVADLFAEDYEGGAELTTDALIKASNFNVIKIRSRDINVELVQKHQNDYWVFGNFAGLNFNLIPLIVSNLNYAVLEYDYKFCNYRSIEKHKVATGKDCDCANQVLGKYVSSFYYAADHIFWMSAGQRDRYHTYFPFLIKKNQTVLSSVFDQNFFNVLEIVKQDSNSTREGWIVLGSDSWIKGKDAAIKWCEDNQKKYEIVWNIPYADLLGKLACAEGFVYLPLGGDTCPRMVIEAKLLGCQVVVNNNVQHSNEKWWQSSPDDVCDYLKGRPRVFWSIIEKYATRNLSSTGCLVTQDAIANMTPFIEAIESLSDAFDEVIVVDAGSKDETFNILSQVSADNKKIIVSRSESRDLNAAWNKARNNCNTDIIWFSSQDEVLDDNHLKILHDLIKGLHKSHQIIALPTLTYLDDNLTIDITKRPWSKKLVKNYPHIGVKFDNACLDFINSETNEQIQFGSFFNTEAETLFNNAQLSQVIKEDYLKYIQQITSVLPTTRKYRLQNG